jgi:hypothetical protein
MASPDEVVSTRGPIAIRYLSLFWFSNEHDFYKAKNLQRKSGLPFIPLCLKGEKDP